MSVSVHPTDVLGFRRPLTRDVKCTLTITNNSAHPVAFKIKISKITPYKVHPNLGRVEPWQRAKVLVTLWAMKEEPPLGAECKHIFLIESTSIAPEEETLPPAEIFRTADRHIRSQELGVTYLPPEETDIRRHALEDELDRLSVTAVKDYGPPLDRIDFRETFMRSWLQSQKNFRGNGVNVAANHASLRQPTPHLSREQDLDEKLAEATANTKINRLGGLLPAMPEPDAKEEPETLRDSSSPDDGQLSRHSIVGNDNVSGKDIDDGNYPTAPPILSPTPINLFSREGVVNDILDLTDQVASVALFGPIGVGKSFVARSVLDHHQTKAKFGEDRHIMLCDGTQNSLEGFLERLSEAIKTNVTQLQSRLHSSPPLILLIDNVDSILDSQVPEAEEVLATIEEFGSYEHVCLVTTSRIYPNIHGFHRVEVPTLSKDDAREAFYNLCNLGRSPAVDTLITKLDSHPLSIELLASYVRDNNWDEPMLLKVWGNDETGVAKMRYYRRLGDAIEPMLRSPTITKLGAAARDVLEAIATFPSGVEESELGRILHKVAGIGEVIDVLCKISLIYREDGFVKMLLPFQFYFLEFMVVPAQREEVINVKWGPNCMPAPARFPVYTEGPIFDSLVDDLSSTTETLTDQDARYTNERPSFPEYDTGPSDGGPSHSPAPRVKAPSRRRREWIKRLPRLVKKRLLALFGRLIAPTILKDIQEDPANPLPAEPVPTEPVPAKPMPTNTVSEKPLPAIPEEQTPCTPVAYEID